MEPVPQSVNVTRTREDYFAFSKQACKTGTNFRNIRIYYYVAIVVTVVVFINAVEMATRYKLLPVWLMQMKYLFLAFCILGMSAAVTLICRLLTPMAKREYLNENQNFLRPKRISFDETGIRETSDVGDAFSTWQGVDRIEKSKDFLLVFIDRLQAYCIPLRNFSTPQKADAFYESMLAYWRKAHGKA